MALTRLRELSCDFFWFPKYSLWLIGWLPENVVQKMATNCKFVNQWISLLTLVPVATIVVASILLFQLRMTFYLIENKSYTQVS